MYNQKITYDVTNKYWVYAPVKYWPNGIDLANTDDNNAPSSTAVETGVQKVSFFAYAPFAAVTGLPDPTSNKYASADDIYGTIPVGTDGTDEPKYFKTEKYAATLAATNGGVVGMSGNVGISGQSKDPWVNYTMRDIAAQNTSDAIASQAVDLLWGLRGQYAYDETDNEDNIINTLGAAYNTDLTKQSVGEKVRFLFKHALAKVGGSESSKSADAASKKLRSGLKVVLDVDANSTKTGEGSDNQANYFGTGFSFNQGTANEGTTLVTINEIKIQDGTSASADNTNAVTDAVSDFKTAGWFNLATGEWKNQVINPYGSVAANGSPLIYNITVPDDANKYFLNPEIAEPAAGALKNKGGVEWQNTNSSADGYTGHADLTGVVPTVVKNVFADTYTTGTPDVAFKDGTGSSANDIPALVLIPGDENSEQTLYVTVKYTVRTADPNLNINGESGDNIHAYSEVEQTISNKVTLKGLEANKYYTLVMHLGLTSIKFEAVVADWAPSTESKIDENGETTSGGTEEQHSVWLPSNVVNTTTVYADAGTTHKTVTVADTQTSYVVTLSGLTAGSTLAETHTGSGISSIAFGGLDEGKVPASGTATATITLTANLTANDVTNTVTITETPAAGTLANNTTKLTLIQQKSVLILTPSTKTIAYNEDFSIQATHANGTKYALTGTPTITVKNSAGTVIGSGTVNGSDNSIIDVDVEVNPLDEDRTVIVEVTTENSVKGQDANDGSESVKVVQGAATTTSLILTVTGDISQDGTTAAVLSATLADGTTVVDLDIADVTVKPTWMTVTENTDTKKLDLKASANGLGVDRSTTIKVEKTIDGVKHTKTIKVIQKGA